jgi:HlyD family secretion protein
MKKSGVIISLMLLTLLLAACGSGQPAATPDAAATLPPVKDTAAVSSEGKLEPLQFANLGFAAGGEVAEVLVKEGDPVKTGDVIARLRTDAQQNAIAQAEAGVAVAKANEAKYVEQLPQQIDAAEAEVQSAQAQVASASAKYNNQAEVAAAKAALAQAKVDQKAAEDAYQRVIDKQLFGPTEEQSRLALETAKRGTEAAQLRLDQLTGDRANAAGLTAASARLKAAEANLEQLKAEANGQPNPTYAAAIAQAEAALKSAQARLIDAELKAPFDGTIAQVNVKVGEMAAPGTPVVVLADLSGWQIETDDLTEIKVPTVGVGQAVTVKADALPDVELKGEVATIGALFQEKSGDVVYPVKVKLLDNDPRLRWGMTVNVTFGK